MIIIFDRNLTSGYILPINYETSKATKMAMLLISLSSLLSMVPDRRQMNKKNEYWVSYIKVNSFKNCFKILNSIF